MEFIKYEIKKGDTLESIAKSHNISIEDMLVFHNKNCGITQQIIGVNIPIYLKEIIIETKSEKVFKSEEINFIAQKLKYRCEQKVFTEINSVPVSNATTKRDYAVKTFIENGNFFVKVKLLDNILTIHPQNYTAAAQVVADIDLIKCNDVVLQINKKNGSIIKIVNHNEIISGWQLKKAELENATKIFPKEEMKKDVADFIALIDSQIMSEQNLIDDFKGKILFDVYFTKFLVNGDDKLDTYKTDFKSQLFEGQRTKISIKQDVIDEKKESYSVRKVSTMLSNDSSRAEKLYNERYKPMIGYEFSSYKASFRESSTYEVTTNTLRELSVTIMEQVVNNLNLNIHYTIRKID